MKAKRNENIEWLFIIALILPTIILGKFRMHQQNLALFLICMIVSVAIVMFAYFAYRKNYFASDEERQEASEKNE